MRGFSATCRPARDMPKRQHLRSVCVRYLASAAGAGLRTARAPVCMWWPRGASTGDARHGSGVAFDTGQPPQHLSGSEELGPLPVYSGPCDLECVGCGAATAQSTALWIVFEGSQSFVRAFTPPAHPQVLRCQLQRRLHAVLRICSIASISQTLRYLRRAAARDVESPACFPVSNTA